MDGPFRVLGVLACVAAVAAACSQGQTPAASVVPTVSPTATATGTPTPSPSAPAGATAKPSATPSPTPKPTPPPATPTSPPRWVGAGSLSPARGATHGVLLDDGRVLVVGDDNTCMPGGAWDTSAATELFDPPSGAWQLVDSLNAPREYFVAAPLPGGKALVGGGNDDTQIAYSSTKIFDPAAGHWTNAALLHTARTGAAGTLLEDGRVLVAGGRYVDASHARSLDTTEIFDPATGAWTMSGKLVAAREGGTAVTLSDGRVLLAGGTDANANAIAAAEIWDPATGAWTNAGTLATPREAFALVALPDGSALVAGGFRTTGNRDAIAAAERWYPASKGFMGAGTMLTAAGKRMAVVLADGHVLVAGGVTERASTATTAAEIYDGGRWTATAPLPSKRAGSAGVLLGDGSVLVVGGDIGLEPPASTPWCPKTIAAAVRYVPAGS